MSPKKRNIKKSKNGDSDPEIDDVSENEEYNDLEFHKNVIKYISLQKCKMKK